MAKGFLFIWKLWSVKTCSFYFQALTNWNYELLLEILTLSSKISYGRDIVEPAFKPGETALVCTYISLHSITQSQNAFSPNSPAIGEYVPNPLTIWFVIFFPCKIWINELLYLSQGFPEINYNDHLVDYQNFCQRLYIVNETGIKCMVVIRWELVYHVPHGLKVVKFGKLLFHFSQVCQDASESWVAKSNTRSGWIMYSLLCLYRVLILLKLFFLSAGCYRGCNLAAATISPASRPAVIENSISLQWN